MARSHSISTGGHALNTWIKTGAAVLAIVALAACSGGASSSADSSAASSDNSSSSAMSDSSSSQTADNGGSSDTDAISKMVSAEDNDFSDLKGDKKQSDATDDYYSVTAPLTGQACIMMQHKTGSSVVLLCTQKSASQSDADAAFKLLKANVSSASPALTWKDVNTTSGKYISQWLAQDSTHAVLIYEKQIAPGQYVVSAGFAKPAFWAN